jgi:hypothetical protein
VFALRFALLLAFAFAFAFAFAALWLAFAFVFVEYPLQPESSNAIAAMAMNPANLSLIIKPPKWSFRHSLKNIRPELERDTSVSQQMTQVLWGISG